MRAPYEISIHSQLDYDLSGTCDILLQLEAASAPGQDVLESNLDLGSDEPCHRVDGESGIGSRLWLRRTDKLTVDYTAKVSITRDLADLAQLQPTPLHELPGDIIQYLMGSRYCDVASFQGFIAAEFSDIPAGPRMLAISKWIEEKFTYTSGFSNSSTTAVDTFVARQGICRDYAHVMIALARASAVPARIASVYSPDVTPPDFHAVAQVYLGGQWHLLDPTGMSSGERMAIVGVGRDAADVSFMTVYGAATLNNQQVEVTKL